MIVYITKTEHSPLIPVYLRITKRELMSRMSHMFPKGIEETQTVKLFNIKFSSINLPGNLWWNSVEREFIKDSLELKHNCGNTYDTLVERDRQIIDEWVKEGEEK